jgi:histidine triad (HIT) family protein
MENCVFCKIISGEIPAVKIWEDDKHIAMLDINPVKPGHVLIIPKKHTEYIFDLDDKEYNLLMMKAKEIAKKLKIKLNSKRIGMAVEGFRVPHVHVHLIPVDKENDLNSKRTRPLNAEELSKMAERLKE